MSALTGHNNVFTNFARKLTPAFPPKRRGTRPSTGAGMTFFVGMILLLTVNPAYSENLTFTKDDRVLIIAPHPDDEAIGCAGAIQSALGAGAKVKVVYLTHGESNELSALFHQKRPMITKVDFVKIGRLRKREALKAMSLLQVPEKDLIFFGYPDMGTMPIWERFWTSKKPFRGFFTRINKVIHEDDFSYGKYYRGYNIVHDFEKVLLELRPTHVFVTAPTDQNLDHQAASLFLKVALLNLEGRLEKIPSVHLYLVHEHDWPKPRKLAPSLSLDPPASKESARLQWARHELSPEQVQKKEQSLLSYESQMSYSKNFLLSFVRTNEIYAAPPREIIATLPGNSEQFWEAESAASLGVEYAANDKELFISIPIVYAIDELGTFSTHVFSYKKSMPFTQMPKLKFRLFGGKLYIKDGARSVSDPGIRFKVDKKRLFIRIPRKSLKNPETLFVSTKTAKNRLAFDFGVWRVIELQ